MRWGCIVVAVITLAFAGCGVDQEGQHVKDDLQTFLTAINEGDAEGVCTTVSPESRRMLDVMGRGFAGAGAGCQEAMEVRLAAGAGELPSSITEAVEAADVDIDGDEARVKGEGEDERLPMRKDGGRWTVDVANSPELQAYGLRGTAACTTTKLEALERPLPKPTRPGIARDLKLLAGDLARVREAVKDIDPPEGQDDAARRVDGMIRAVADAYRRASVRIRLAPSPLNAFNAASVEAAKRSDAVAKDMKALQVGCLGAADTLRPAAAYRKGAARACRTAGRRLRGIARRRDLAAFAPLGRDTARALRRLRPPRSLASTHRAAVAAHEKTYVAVSLRTAGQERIELMGLQASIGFMRLGLPACAVL